MKTDAMMEFENNLVLPEMVIATEPTLLTSPEITRINMAHKRLAISERVVAVETLKKLDIVNWYVQAEHKGSFVDGHELTGSDVLDVFLHKVFMQNSMLHKAERLCAIYTKAFDRDYENHLLVMKRRGLNIIGTGRRAISI